MSDAAWRWPRAARVAAPRLTVDAEPFPTTFAATRHQPVRLILQVLRPAALALMVVLLLFLFGVSRYLHSVEVRRTEALAQHAVAMWQHLRQQQLGQLQLLTSTLAEDRALAQAMQQGDAARLQALSRERFAQLRQTHGVSHGYFIDLQRQVLLRAHDPAQRGDLVERRTLLDAISTGKPVSGMELGALSTFTLRHVQPWYLDGQLIGYLELGSDADWFVHELKRLLQQDMALLIDKRHTSQARYQGGQRVFRLPGQWGDDARVVVLGQTLSHLPGGLLPAWRDLALRAGSGVLDLSDASQAWSVAIRPITDHSGREMASLAVLRDVAPERADEARQRLNLAAAGTAIVALLMGVLFLRVRAAEDWVRRSDAALRLAATAFESQEGIMVLDERGAILRVNQAFTDITGYTFEEVQGKRSEILRAPDCPAPLTAHIQQQLRQHGHWLGDVRSQRHNGEIYDLRLSLTLVRGRGQEPTLCVGSFTDVTEHKAAEARIEHLAFFDTLTGLPNRRQLQDQLQQVLAGCHRQGQAGAVLLIDLDDFKTLNDTLGHDMGDLLLQHMTARLQTCLGEHDTLARWGGDEFVVVMQGLSPVPAEATGQAHALAARCLSLLSQSCDLAGQEYHISCSIGITLFGTPPPVSLDELMRQADLAMSEAKAAGRHTLRFFDPDMQAALHRRSALEADMRRGLQRHEFQLYYQPQVDAAGRVFGTEALVRWHHPERGMVSPAEFIPAAEHAGLILPLGAWVLETACQQLVTWSRQPDLARLTVSVNVSVRQFRLPDFVDLVLGILARTGANPHRLKLELTESVLIDDVEAVVARMDTLKGHGVGFSLDDFGTGYSSLAYLKRLPLDQLKIDQSFVRDVLTDPHDASIARTIVALADAMGLAVIAEGVETEAQRDFLHQHGCRSYQGYLFGRPMPADAFAQHVRG